MKITFLLPIVNLSGGVRVAAIYAQWLHDHGHDITVISVSPDRPTPYQVVRALVKERKWLTSKPEPSHFDGLQLKHITLPPGHKPNDSNVPDSDVVIATWWETAEWAAALSARKGRKVYFIQHHEVFDFVPTGRCEATYRLPFQQIAVAQWLADVMREHYGRTDCAVVPNAVDHSAFYPLSLGKPRCMTIGALFNLATFKGFDTSAQILRALKARHPELKILLVGSATAPQDLVVELGAEAYLSPPQEQIREIYNRCKVWLSTSRSEGFNLMAMEAMACGTPVVSTRTGWPVEAIHNGFNGQLIDIDSVDQGVAACEQVLQLDKADWQIFSTNAHNTVKDINWESSARQFEGLLMQPPEKKMPAGTF
jgi:glycosyltransferase involved in cell wall biosynthesis